jgi:hypothetical protein
MCDHLMTIYLTLRGRYFLSSEKHVFSILTRREIKIGNSKNLISWYSYKLFPRCPQKGLGFRKYFTIEISSRLFRLWCYIDGGNRRIRRKP